MLARVRSGALRGIEVSPRDPLTFAGAALLLFREPRLHKAEANQSLGRQLASTYRTILAPGRLRAVVALTVAGSVLMQGMLEFGPLWLVALAVPAFLYGPHWAGLTAALGLGGLLGAQAWITRRWAGGLVALAVIACCVVLALSHLAALVVGVQVLLTLLVVAVSNTPAFRTRFFFNEEATLTDVVTLSDQLNTAGRRELWPELVKRCSPAAMTGLGISSSNALSVKLSGLDHPHNEYLRVYCDEGWIGSILIWSFFAWATVRSWRGALEGQDTSLHAAAGQLTLALLLFAITDNPLDYTALFMAPMAVILGLSDRALLMERMSIRRAENHRAARPPLASWRAAQRRVCAGSSGSGTRPAERTASRKPSWRSSAIRSR